LYENEQTDKVYCSDVASHRLPESLHVAYEGIRTTKGSTSQNDTGGNHPGPKNTKPTKAKAWWGDARETAKSLQE